MARHILLLLALAGFSRAQEYFCPMNDDGCDWQMDSNKEFCYKIFNMGKTYEDALATCQAHCIDGCESTLLEVSNVDAVAMSMSDQQAGECPPNLRLQTFYDAEQGSWVDNDLSAVSFPLGYTNVTGEPTSNVNLAGFTGVVNLVSTTIYGNVRAQDHVGYICQSCLAVIPVCPEACEDCVWDDSAPGPAGLYSTTTPGLAQYTGATEAAASRMEL